MKLRLFGEVNDSIVDGPGLRYVVFTQGCLHRCLGCHNPQSHELDAGKLEDIDNILIKIDENPLLDGVTISGGEPFLQPLPLLYFVKKLKQRHLHVMIYSGYTYEEIIELGSLEEELLALCDILVDGRFVEAEKSLTLMYRGSANQRVIDISKTMQKNQIVEQEINEYGEFV